MHKRAQIGHERLTLEIISNREEESYRANEAQTIHIIFDHGIAN